MGIQELLGIKVGAAAAKFLLRKYLSIPDDIGGGLAEVLATKVQDWQQQREAQRQFERIGDAIANRLLPLFERESQSGAVNPEAVAIALGEALQGRVSAEFFLEKDLDPRRLTDDLRRLHTVPPGHFSEAESSLYDRALAEAVRYIIGSAASLPKFEATLAAQSLTRLSHMQAGLDKVLDGVQRIESSLVGRGRDEAERFEADYRQAVLRNLDYLELFGADIPPEARRHSLSVAYVSLNLQRADAKGAPSDSLPAEVLLSELLPGSARLLIRGGAGSGKTTLFRWAAIQTAVPESAAGSILKATFETMPSIQSNRQDRPSWSALWTAELDRVSAFVAEAKAESMPSTQRVMQERLLALEARAKRNTQLAVYLRHSSAVLRTWFLHGLLIFRNRVPFLVRLRDCAGGHLPPPESFPGLVAKEIGEPPANWVTCVLREGRGLVLLDGVDEVPGRFRDAVLHQEIKALVDAYPDNSFIVSTRPEAVEDAWLADVGFGEARINPMSDLDKRLFIDKWHEAVAAELARRDQSTAGLESLAGELKNKLADNPPMNRLAANPLLCAMICALHRDRCQKLPESQSELCEALCHMLLHRRELESGLNLDAFPEPYRRLSYSQKKLLVQEIAHHMVAHTGESVISRERAAELVRTQLGRMPGQQSEDAPVVLKALVERCGMLREATPATPQRPAQFDFLHNTFKEYLAGLRLADDDAYGQLADNAGKPDWLPVLLFAAATDRKGFASRLIQKLLGEAQAPLKPGARPAARGRPKKAKPAPEEQEQRQRTLIALRCRALALDLDPPLHEQLDSSAKSLLPPRSLTDAEALAACGDLAVPFLKPQRRLAAEKAAACVRALRLIGTDLARRQLREYLDDKRSTVISELAQAVNPLDIRAVQRMVQQPAEELPEYSEEFRRQRAIRSQIQDLAPLYGFTNVQRLDLRGTRVSDLQSVSCLRGLEELSLVGAPVSDLRPIANLKSLRSLNLRGTQAEDLGPLAGLTALTQLDLSHTPVTGAGFDALRELKGLQHLDLSRTQVTDAGLDALRDLKRLQWLTLSATGVTDAGLDALRELKALQHLDLSGTGVTGAGLDALRDLKRLQWLTLSATEVTGAGLDALRELKALQHLDLSHTKVADAGLDALHELKALQHLDLSGTGVTGAGLGALRELKALQYLDLTCTGVTDAGLDGLRELKALQHLDLFGTGVADAGLDALRELKALQSLALSGTQVTDAGLDALRELKELQMLTLVDTQVTDAGLEVLGVLERLRHLNIAGTRVTDQGLGALQKLLCLQEIDLGDTNVTDVGLHALRELKTLRMLFVVGSKVSDQGRVRFRRARPDCYIE